MANKNETSKNLRDWENTLRAESDWVKEYREWWENKYGAKTEEEFAALTNGSTPPPPPPPVPPTK